MEIMLPAAATLHFHHQTRTPCNIFATSPNESWTCSTRIQLVDANWMLKKYTPKTFATIYSWFELLNDSTYYFPPDSQRNLIIQMIPRSFKYLKELGNLAITLERSPMKIMCTRREPFCLFFSNMSKWAINNPHIPSIPTLVVRFPLIPYQNPMEQGDVSWFKWFPDYIERGESWESWGIPSVTRVVFVIHDLDDWGYPYDLGSPTNIFI